MEERMAKSAKPAAASHTRLSGGASTVSGAPGWLDGELAALGNQRGDVAKNHWTVR
jgi:hypothetical protein